MASLESIFNHLVLPPKLSEREDPDIELIAANIATRLTRASDTLAKLSNGPEAATWASVSHSLGVCRKLNVGRLDKSSLLAEFRHLEPSLPLILYVVEQNASVLIRQH